MRQKSWFRAPRRESGHAQRAHDASVPLDERIRKAARAAKVTSKARITTKGKWIEHATKAKRRAR
jgi:hypothetical protein